MQPNDEPRTIEDTELRAEGTVGPADSGYEYEVVPDQPRRETDADIKSRQENELQAERDYRRERLGHTGPAAGAGPVPGYVVPDQPREPETYDTETNPNATEADADYDVDEVDETKESQTKE